jgi:hypothetical protein
MEETRLRFSETRIHGRMIRPAGSHIGKPSPTVAEQTGADFQRRLAKTITKDFPSAVRLVRDHFPRHLGTLSGDQLFRIGVAFYQEADLGKARRCLELAADKDGSWQHKALLLISRTYEAVGNVQQAMDVIRDLLGRRPSKTLRRQAMKRLVQLQEHGSH